MNACEYEISAFLILENGCKCIRGHSAKLPRSRIIETECIFKKGA